MPVASLPSDRAAVPAPGSGTCARLSRTGFCRLAPVYAFLEKIAFGRGLERVRFCLLGELRDCREILLLGEGDGRCLAQVLKVAPQARCHVVDSSPAMLQHAASRLAASDRVRVTFECADVLTWQPPHCRYDAVVSLFFLDCFEADDVRRLVDGLTRALRPGAKWVWADFVLPEKGPARWRAQGWLAVMYGFFRIVTQLPARQLPPTENILHRAGWRPAAVRQWPFIFARCAVYSQPGWGT